MKSHIRRQYTNRQKQIAAELCDLVICETVVRVKRLMCIAMNDELGIGAKRMHRVIERYDALAAEYKEAQADDVAEVVRCKECIYRGWIGRNIVFCENFERDMMPDDFCSCGERREK